MEFLSKTVLVVEDNEQYRSVYRDIIESDLKAKYREAEDPRVAFEMLKKQHPDLIILDTHMPYMDGLSVLNVLRGSNQFQSIPVIVTSETADETMVHLLLERGISDFVLKPFDRELAKAKIVRALSSIPKV